jgi:hypothetical protein
MDVSRHISKDNAPSIMGTSRQDGSLVHPANKERPTTLSTAVHFSAFANPGSSSGDVTGERKLAFAIP